MRRTVVIVAAAAAACVAPVSAGAATNNTRLLMALQMSNARHGANVNNDLLRNCALFFSGGTSPEGNPPIAGVDGPATGALHPATRSGEVFAKRNNWQVEALAPSHARPATFADLGFALRGSTVFLTGRLTHGRAFLVRAGRKKLAVVRHAQITNGPLVDQKRHPVPNTYTFLARGKLRMLSPMARAIERTRCRGSRNRQSRRLKTGYLLGKLTVGYRPSAASGLAGTAQLTPGASTVDTGDPVGVEPTGGAGLDNEGTLMAQIASGLPAPLFCFAGEDCGVSGGNIGLAGGFDLVFSGRRTSVTNIAIATSGKPPSDLQHTVTGLLDGAPVTVATSSAGTSALTLTDDFDQRAGAALGTQISGALYNLKFSVTSTGPPG